MQPLVHTYFNRNTVTQCAPQKKVSHITEHSALPSLQHIHPLMFHIATYKPSLCVFSHIKKKTYFIARNFCSGVSCSDFLHMPEKQSHQCNPVWKFAFSTFHHSQICHHSFFYHLFPSLLGLLNFTPDLFHGNTGVANEKHDG